MELNFSFKKEKPVVAEKYPNLPVLTYIGGDKTSKFELNRKAVELLGYENSVTARISFGLASTEQMFLANTTGAETGNQNNLTLTNSFSSSKLLDRMQKFFEITLVEGDEFLLSTVNEKLDYPILMLTVDNPNSKTQDNFSEFPDDEFEEEDDAVEEVAYEQYEVVQ